MVAFDDFFRTASGGVEPFPYQRRLALDGDWPARVEVPTGLGKTLAVLTSWLWRRQRAAGALVPRRLIYCLPMRVLVEQTRQVATEMLERLGLQSKVKVVVLMGGEQAESEWDNYPEQDLIVVGTQDMLLSRALNRGYGMSRYRWPLHFGLLNNDCLWVIDEVQLMGVGVATTAQLQALRRKLGALLPCHTSWMSATLDETWLRTVDTDDADLAGHLQLDDADRACPAVAKRIGARKLLARAAAVIGDSKALAREILTAHRTGTRTIAVVNTVERAREVFVHLRKATPDASLVLLHSRFRPNDRDHNLNLALAPPPNAGTIVVSTQVIEAGVDVTAATLFTEVAPWASLVQRFGRCNRRGDDEDARVFWVDLPVLEKDHGKLGAPYSLTDLTEAREVLASLREAGPSALPRRGMSLESQHVLRRRDLLDLFDTTPDLMGADVDVSRFIRDTDDHDVRVFWRDFREPPDPDGPAPFRQELCAAPIALVRAWVDEGRPVWTWDALQGGWCRVARDGRMLRPGLSLMLASSSGGYDSEVGLEGKSTKYVEPVPAPLAPHRHESDRSYFGDPESEWSRWYTLTQHSDDVAAEAHALAEAVALPAHLASSLVNAGRWHDAGKAHEVWQRAAKRLGADPPTEAVAKSSAQGKRLRFEERPGFRHELASALLALANGQSDLVCFLIACHHGKVRASFRALPVETPPRDPSVRFARGVWEGDQMPAIDLGNGVQVGPATLTLSYMELGDDEVTGPSWVSRVMALRDAPEMGPFRLGLLEALIKCADERASRRARGGGER